MASKYQALFARMLPITAVAAWGLANALDVFSVLLALQLGGILAYAQHHPAASFLIYAGLRALGTLALWLAVAAVSNRWPGAAGAAWSGLTACALVTAVIAWWRLYG